MLTTVGSLFSSHFIKQLLRKTSTFCLIFKRISAQYVQSTHLIQDRQDFKKMETKWGPYIVTVTKFLESIFKRSTLCRNKCLWLKIYGRIIQFKLIHFKTTAFQVVMILKFLLLLEIVTLNFHYWCSLQKPLMIPKTLLRTRNTSRAKEWENMMLNLSVTLQNLKKAGHCLINVLFLLKFVIVLCFSLLLNFCCFTAECNECYFQVTTTELDQVKIYLKYSSGVFQVLLHLNFTWTSGYLNLVQVNLPELFLECRSANKLLGVGNRFDVNLWYAQPIWFVVSEVIMTK